ncbi:MAG TPA: hypothetical protein VGY55_03590 [Pirellulales bacterium]|nr:hypothetical protein [Pirellulales bacterium]
MSIKHLAFTSVALLAASIWAFPNAPLRGQDPAGGPDQEVLTHGPVHEAYAEPTVSNPTEPLVVPKQAPAPIEEMPPDVKPDGANVVWIAGYWAWDDTRNDFIWVSGIWRDTPPNYVWVAGYWSQVANGFQWTPGFWSPAEQQQVSYLPEPPQSLESGPNTPQPSADDFWVPGNYQYVETRYVWRPGYWTVAQPDWIWTPAHFVWSPSGYIFIPGHWDYVLARRGVLFAPVYFSAPIYARRHFVFAPSVVIDSNLLTVNFFVRPNYCHYYFGDYYGENFVALGFNPWFSVGVRFGPDPLFAYYRWDHRDDRRWAEGQREHFAYMNSHPEARPPRTYAQQTTIINNNITINKNTNNIAIGAPLNQYVKNVNNSGGNNVKFVNVSTQQREQFAQQAVQTHDMARERAKLESPSGGPKNGPLTGGPNLGGTPKTLNLRNLAQSGGGQLPGSNPTGAGANVRTNTNINSQTGGPSNERTGAGGKTFGGPNTANPGAGTIPGNLNYGRTGTGSGTLPGGTTGPGTAGGTTSGRGPSGASGPSTDIFRARTGEALKSGSGSSNGPGPGGPSGSGSNAKKFEDFNNKGPSFSPPSGRGGGPPPSPTPSDRGRSSSGDSRGKKPDDSKGGSNGPGGGRAFFAPGNSRGLADAQNAVEEPVDSRAKDPIRPLTLNPSLAPTSRTANGLAASRSSFDLQPQQSVKDPVRPLNLLPQSQPRSSTGPVPANGPAPRGNSDPRGKDPIQPLRLAPNN